MSTQDVNIYLITFFHPNGGQIAFAVNQYLLDSVDILGFWNYIPLVYGVKTKLNAAELTQKLASIMQGGHFLVTRIDPYDINGRLPPPAWSWFYSPPTEPGNRPAAPKAITPPAPGGFPAGYFFPPTRKL